MGLNEMDKYFCKDTELQNYIVVSPVFNSHMFLIVLGGVESKIQLFQNMVMLHIKLKGIAHAAI